MPQELTKPFTNYRESHKGRGHDYHRSFAEVPHRVVMWELEQKFLHSILGMFPRPDEVRMLDFAAGTGRIIGTLEPHVARAVGVDVAESMLECARQNGVRSELIVADLTSSDAPEIGTFDLITAFRFFPNAEPALRSSVIKALAGRLAPGGRLVFNNHLNASGSVFWLMRLFKKPFAREAVPEREMHELIASVGLRIERTFHAGVAPATEFVNIFPTFLLRPFERLASQLPFLRPWAQNIVYVCRKM